MFNPYNCRPIGSERFLEHLKDVQTSSLYDSEFQNAPEFLTDLHVGGHVPWQQAEIKEDPYTRLYWAIVAGALIEYLEAYDRKLAVSPDKPSYWINESRCLTLENDYFRTNPTLEAIFDGLLINVCWLGREEIQNCRKRLMRAIGWLKRPERRTT